MNQSGQKIDQSSKENKVLRSATEVNSQTNVNNVNNVTVTPPSTPQVSSQPVDDRPAIQRKK